MTVLPAEDNEHVYYTIHLNGRDPAWPQLTLDEASEALAAGIRFSIYDEHKGEFNVSIPYSTIQHVDRHTLTIMQQLEPVVPNAAARKRRPFATDQR
jgi:hypothetical protein